MRVYRLVGGVVVIAVLMTAMVGYKASASSWQGHDRAVYVVSTLNGPLCPSGEQLSTVLWQRDKARVFSVLKSRTDNGLYYIRVRKADKTILGVYAYRFGWKAPVGVKNSKCVAVSTDPAVVGPYNANQTKWVANFHTTYPT